MVVNFTRQNIKKQTKILRYEMFDLVVLSTNLQVGRLNIVVFSEATIRRGSGKYCRKTLVLESLLKHAKQVFYCEFCNILNPFSTNAPLLYPLKT